MVTAKRKHRRRYEPLVPVLSHKLRSAIREAGVSENVLAKELGIKQQTLNDICRGRCKSCRSSMLDRFATRLGVTTAWLSGESRTLPGASHDLVEVLDLENDAVDEVSSVQIAQSRFWQKCRKAWRRDHRHRSGQLDVRKPGKLEAEFFVSIMTLLHPVEWRLRLLAPSGHHPASPTEWAGITPPLADALEVILQPWFEGKAKLDYGALRRWRTTFAKAHAHTDTLAIVPRMPRKRKRLTKQARKKRR